MNPTLLLAEETSTLADSHSPLLRADIRLKAAAARRDAARFTIACTLPATPDCFWRELDEAEHQYWEALRAHAKAFGVA